MAIDAVVSLVETVVGKIWPDKSEQERASTIIAIGRQFKLEGDAADAVHDATDGNNATHP